MIARFQRFNLCFSAFLNGGEISSLVTRGAVICYQFSVISFRILPNNQ
jgi:hypothetical protein